jgi:hypothetical protein
MSNTKTRKELTREYKEQKLPMGVFQVRNTASGKIFIGSSTNLNAARNGEMFKLEMGGHMNTALQTDYKALGASTFVFEILHELKLPDDAPDPRGELKALEAMTIEDLQPFGEKGYNKMPKI